MQLATNSSPVFPGARQIRHGEEVSVMAPEKRKRLTRLAIVIVLGAFSATVFTAVDVSSEAEPSQLEKQVAGRFLEMKIRLKGLARNPPFNATIEDLAAGGEMYRARCSFCHGGFDGKPAFLAKSFSPRPLQFPTDPPQRSTWMNAYIIRHGIRWTAMPASPNLSEADAWRIASFLNARARQDQQK
jgi:hypothetical protein